MSEEQTNYITERAKAENAMLKKYSAMQKASEDRIGCQKIYIDMTGDIEAAFVLDEIIYYTLPRDGHKSGLRIWKGGYLWMAVRRSEWWERKRLTERQADRAIEKLIELNLITKSVHKFNGQPTTHIRLNIPEFFKNYAVQLEKMVPSESEIDSIIHDISELYEIMNWAEEDSPSSKSPNGKLPNGDTESPNGDTESPNGDFINNHYTITTQSLSDLPENSKPQKRGDLVDGYLELSQSPGLKRMARVDAILSYLAVEFNVNTERKAWKEFAKFADDRQQHLSQSVEVFVKWLKSQPGFDMNFWSAQRMMEHWPRAFAAKPSQPQYQSVPERHGVPRPTNLVPNIRRSND
jgi:hypothetical protein